MDASPLLKLPGELRNIIYEYSCSSSEDIHVRPWICRHPYARPPRYRKSVHVALTATCKQVRQESEPIFFGINTFVISCRLRPGDFGDGMALPAVRFASKWLHRVGSRNWPLFTRLVLDLGSLVSYHEVAVFMASPALIRHHSLQSCGVHVRFRPFYPIKPLDLPLSEPLDVEKAVEAFRDACQVTQCWGGRYTRINFEHASKLFERELQKAAEPMLRRLEPDPAGIRDITDALVGVAGISLQAPGAVRVLDIKRRDCSQGR